MIVLGNQSGDLDSVISAVGLSALVNFAHNRQVSLARLRTVAAAERDPEFAAITETFISIITTPMEKKEAAPALPIDEACYKMGLTNEIISSLLVSIVPLKFFPNCDWPTDEMLVLVDHYSVPGGALGCFDHHEVLDDSEMPVHSYVRTPRASTCSFVGMLWLMVTGALDTSFEKAKEIAALLSLTIRMDSYNFDEEFHGSRWVDADHSVHKRLRDAADLDAAAMKVLYHKVKDTQKQYRARLLDGGKPLHKILLEDNKVFSYRGGDLLYASLPILFREQLRTMEPKKMTIECDAYIAQTRPRGRACFVATSKAEAHREITVAARATDAAGLALMRSIERRLNEVWSAHWIMRKYVNGDWVFSILRVDLTKTRKVIEPSLRAVFDKN